LAYRFAGPRVATPYPPYLGGLYVYVRVI